MSLHSCYLVLHDVLIGDQIEVAREMHQRYRPTTRQHVEFYRTLPKISVQQQYIHEMNKSHQRYSGDWTVTSWS